MVFKPIYILILFFTIGIDYIAGIQIEKRKGKGKKHFLIASLIANIGVLFVFKYFNFFNNTISSILSFFHHTNNFKSLELLLPIGLSFHTFQAMSYTIEVYRGHQKAERHFGIYALYVMFYPQLVAGPIERPQNILHQIHEVHFPDYVKIAGGLRLMLWGFLKKMVIADHLGEYVDKMYANPGHFHGFPTLLAVLFFSIQIYCDFSGYSDIAIGAARTMGFSLMRNFNMPYFSKSIQEFWSRWHISLSSWFRDYLYIPLGGSRVAKSRLYLNLMIVFLISGLWHGANWTFVVWGALHGLFMILSLSGKRFLPKSTTIPVFLLVTFAWIFFRAVDFNQAWLVLVNCFIGYSVIHPGLTTELVNKLNFSVCIAGALALFLIEYLQLNYTIYKHILNLKTIPRFGLYILLLYIIAVFGVFNNEKFIYFQF